MYLLTYLKSATNYKLSAKKL